MNKQSYLDSRQLQNECNEYIKILKSELLEIEKVSNNIKLVLSETGLKGEAMEAYKKQLNRYFEIFALMKEADKFDIIDYSKLKAEATKTYDGDLICSSYERAKNDRDRYQSKANDERSKAASFNTTVTTLLPGGKVLVEHIPNPYESSAREYQNLADDCQKEMNLWHSKMEEFDAIEARTAGLFVAGKNKRTIAKLKLRTINKTRLLRNTPLPGVGDSIGGLIKYSPVTPTKTTISEDVFKGSQILENELRKMKNEDGTPKYTEKEIREMVDYVIAKYPTSLTTLYYIPNQYKVYQMDVCMQYAMEAKQMIPIDKGADLFANYLRNLNNPDGTPMYTEEEIKAMVDKVLKNHPSALSTLYYAPSQYYMYAIQDCLEYAEETVIEYDYSTYQYTLDEYVDLEYNLSTPQVGPKDFNKKADKDTLRYYLDPSNFINDDVYKFMFLDISASAGISQEQIGKYLDGKGILDDKEEVYYNAAQKNGINEAYLVAHSCLETGSGTSHLAMGIEYTAPDGTKVTVYNMYGIGAEDRDPEGLGAAFAYNMGWTTPELAIEGGAKYIKENYLGNGQTTIYEIRWNPANPGSHQYATDVGWAKKQTPKLKEIMDEFPGAELVFKVPKFAG